MQTHAKTTTTLTLGSLALLLAAAGCGDDQPSAVASDQAQVASFLYVDPAGQPVDDSTAPDAQMIKPVGEDAVAVVDPAGQPVTWGEFRHAGGQVSLSCDGDRTAVTIDATGLIPGATYTAWLMLFGAPGSQVAGLGAFQGYQAVGPSDGSGSVMLSDASGRGHLETTVSAGPVALPVVPDLALDGCVQDTYEAWILLAYHIDGQTCGEAPCDDDKIAEQAFWSFGTGEAP